MIKYLILLILVTGCEEGRNQADRTAELENTVHDLKHKVSLLEGNVDRLQSQIRKLTCRDFSNIRVGQIVSNNGSNRVVIKLGNKYALVSSDPYDDGSAIEIKDGVKTLQEVKDYMTRSTYVNSPDCN